MPRAPAPGPDFSFERAAHAAGVQKVAGMDEAGRGPLAGPVVAACVVLDPVHLPDGLNDSKRLGARRRAQLFDLLHAQVLDGHAQIGIGMASPAEIAAINILQASLLAMSRALAALPCAPDLVLIDGNRAPRDLPCPAQTIVKGDARALSIAAASIIAKVTRDRIMTDLDRRWPGYDWAQNAGYPTKRHINAIADLGVTPEHRRSFAPIRKILCPDLT